VDSIFSGASYVLNKDTQNDIKESLNVLTSAIKAINNSSKIIEKTLTKKNSQINNSIDNIESISSNLANVSNDLNDFDLANVLSNLEMSINGINLIVNNLNSDNSSLGNLINNDDVYDNLNSSIENLNLLITDIKTNPKKYIHFSIFGRK
jgi:phospholipid/cholesterol/gamma-HCH transport system substrate-binding protein